MFPRLALAAAMAALLCASTSVAAPLTNSAYDSGDGDQANAVGALDWQGGIASGLVTQAADPAMDDCYVGGTKELAPGQWAFNTSAGGCIPGKSNVKVALVQPESTSASTFAHFAMLRNSTTGNSFLTFELNQSAATWTNSTGTTVPCRQNGDVLLSFDVGGSSLDTVVYRWTGDGTGPAGCPNGNSGTFQASPSLTGSVFQGAMNTLSAITNYASPATWGATFPANSFGENAINLPAVLASMGQSPCFGFVQMQVHTRSSTSISSAMIDTLGPTPVYLQSCSATGSVFRDANGNGTRDSGEAGQAGFTAYVDYDGDGTPDAGEPSAVSDANGDYRILNVAAGSWKVRIVGQSGWSCTGPSPCEYSRSWVSGGNQTGLDFGLTAPSTVAGTVYTDANADGTRQSGETSLAGRVVFVDYDGDGALGPGEPSATSDGFGAWTITNVASGTYRVREVPGSGWTCSAPAGCATTQTTGSGSSITGIAFGNWQAASVSGALFEDANGDGSAKAAGDAALSGWQVYLDANGNDQFDLGETTTTTSADGSYSFTGLTPGTSTVRAVAASSTWYCTNPSQAAASCERATTLASGDAPTGKDLGYARTTSVSGSAYNDANGNGVKDTGEAVLSGVTVYVDYDGDSNLTAGEPSATTDATGAFSLTGVRAGSWTLRAAQYGTYQCTQPGTCTYALTLASGTSSSGKVFGEYLATAINGTVFLDANRNGAKDAGEAGISGWRVYVDTSNNGAYDAGEPTGVSNASGSYTLAGSANGQRDVRLVAQTGWTCSFPATTCSYRQNFSQQGTSFSSQDFGVYTTAGTISGTVYEDTNGDGSARATGDAALAGRTVWADYDGNGSLDTGEPSATSAADGTYTLSGVKTGTWTVRRAVGSGFVSSYPSGGTWSVTVGATAVTGKDFGAYKPGTIAGQVYEDLAADGARNGSDAGVAGRTVYLDANNNGTRDSGETATTTDSSGNYSFTSVAPGTARVREVLPSGWTELRPTTAHDLTVVSQSAFTGKDFGTYTTGAVAGRVFTDTGFDGGAYSAGTDSPVLTGRTVYVDANGNGARDPGETSATTDATTGSYSLSGLAPGAYTLRTELPAGTACSYPTTCSWTVTVTSQSTSSSRDFGTYAGATVSGTVFQDDDADGAARETGEPALAGRTVYLDDNDNGTLDSGETSTTSGADGTYSLSGLTRTTHVVRVSLGSGWSCDRPSPCRTSVSLTSGATAAGNDFGLHQAGSISGHLWTDSTGGGSGGQAFGDNDQPQRTVYLDANDNGTRDAGETSTTTDASGDYTFPGLAPGAYVVRQVLPDGWVCSWPSPCRDAVTLTSGLVAADRDFSSYTTASISGTYYEDLAAGGLVPDTNGTDPGLAGRQVYLDTNDNGTLDSGEPTATTGAQGTYSFTGLAPGSYRVRSAAQPAGWTCSYVPVTCTQSLSVEAAETAQSTDFGAWTTATISGTAFGDANSDGVHDAGEPAIAHRAVTATPATGATLTTTTDGSGAYAFTGLTPGVTYTVAIAHDGETCTTPADCAYVLITASGASLGGNNFGLVAPASVSGTVWRDADGDGAQDNGEDSLARVVTATPETGDAVSTTSDAATGAYTLDGLVPGVAYTIAVSGAGEACSVPATCRYELTPTIAQHATARDFGLYVPARVSGTVWADGDASGTRDGGESGLSGYTITATADGQDPISTTSGTAGAYTLDGLIPGAEWTITITRPGGERCSNPADCQTVIVPASGDELSGGDFDFGLYTLASVSGTVFGDADASGTRDGGETGRSGVAVTATPATGTPVTTTTAPDGTYTLDGLMPGVAYAITVDGGAERCSTPAACTRTLTPASGDQSTGMDYGLYALASVSGTVYGDTDASGTQDTGETGRTGVTVTATPEHGDAVTATTAADGTYTLTGLTPGTYAITVAHGDELCSAPAGCTRTLTVASGEAPTGRDYGLYAEASVGGTVYGDTDASGTQDSGETGRAGVAVTAVRNGGESVTVTTGTDGSWMLAGLTPGTYTVTVDRGSEQCSAPAACSRTITLGSGDTATNRDFGLYATASAAGTVFGDNDASGTLGAGEAGRSGVTVTATPEQGDPITATTGSDGRYLLLGLRPGVAYAVAVPHPGETCAAPADCTRTLTLASGEALTDRDYALYATASVAGTVYEDKNADGTKDAGEPARPAVTVSAEAAGQTTRTATTDASGDYEISGLRPGVDYDVSVPHPGERCSAPAGCTRSVNLGSGEARTGRHYGLYATVALAGTLFADTNADGLRDAGEAALAGRTVRIDPGTPGDPADDLTLTTDADGAYAADGLRPGVAYTISTSAGTAHYCSAPAHCGATATPASGDGTVTRDFGIATDPASIAGVVWHDLAADGARDGGDPPLEGRTVFLDSNDNGRLDTGEPTAATDASGAFRFTDLAPGIYVVRKDLPSADWHCSAPDSCRRAVTIGAGEDATGASFGIWRTASVSGVHFTDADGDGTRGAGEGGEAGWVVYADLDGNGSRDAGEPRTTTGADGAWTLEGLRPGSYRIREVPQKDRTCTAPADCRHDVSLRSFDALEHRDFGTRPAPAPAAAPPVVGRPTVAAPQPDGPPVVQRETAEGGTLYEVPRTGACTPLTIALPIDDAAGSVSDVAAVFTPAGGGAAQTVTLVPGGDGRFTGTLPCASDGHLEVRYSVDGTPQSRDVGEVQLIDPQGTIYDTKAYAAAIAAGLDADEARCAGALQGATVTLQRESDGRFADVGAQDGGILPAANPETTGEDGGYRWDVAPGTYRVRVSMPGYEAATSRAVAIPPAVTDLHVGLKRLPGTAAPADRTGRCAARIQTVQRAKPSAACSVRPVHTWVRGRVVRRVLFLVDGRAVRTVRRADSHGRFGLTVLRSHLTPGTHRVTAIVTLAHGRTRTLRTTIERCLADPRPRRLSGVPARCTGTPYTAWLAGDAVRRVLYRLDGLVLRDVQVADWRGRYGVRIDPRRLGPGRHVLTAEVAYVKGAPATRLAAVLPRCG